MLEALAELDQVRSTIDDAAREVRAVAHGYRRSDLAVELRGAASLLGSAGVDCKLAGSKLLAQAPAELGWVVREAVTNVLRHSTATLVRITLERRVKGGVAGVAITLRNDGVRPERSLPEPGDTGSGLTGLGERVAALGGTVHGRRQDGDFVLSAWLPSPPAGEAAAESSVPHSLSDHR